ncbi:MAG: 50S ribosomal protein L21 [Clostridia bacterium]|nr:50S ribosomal protein L21 [Clostridia bacterium]MCR5693857.1 50S ribosomal protein L21 [Clostridia bacterium]
MEKYAVILTGGKQYRVSVGDEIFIEKLDGAADDVITFDKVLAIGDAEAVFGAPYVEGATVSGKIVKQGKGRKIRIIKHKAKKGYRKRQGHRQPYTKVVIEAINA